MHRLRRKGRAACRAPGHAGSTLASQPLHRRRTPKIRLAYVAVTCGYRPGEGEIVIINHHGHGWWDPQGSAKGDVFDLVQHLDPSLNFGQVRKELRRLVVSHRRSPMRCGRPV